MSEQDGAPPDAVLPIEQDGDGLGAAAAEDALRFSAVFGAHARPVRRRRALRLGLAGAVLGSLLAAGCAAVAWSLGRPALRSASAAWVLLGFGGGLALSARRRWSDEEVALYLDRALDGDEAIVTAVGLRAGSSGAAGVIRRAAEAVLARSSERAPGPRVLVRWHATALVAMLAFGWIARLEMPPAGASAAGPPAAGAEVVKLEQVAGLEEVRKLVKLDARDAAQRERLRGLAERAERLQQELAKGMPRREAQAELNRLREDVAAELQRFGTGEQRRGLEAALGKLAKSGQLDAARKALGDRDMTRLDEEMESLANRLEKTDRDKAKRALEEAAEAARREGADDVARSLEQQAKRLDEHGAGADALRELADALGKELPESARKSLEGMGAGGSRASREGLARELAKALEGFSEEQRKRLAKRLADAAKGKGGAGQAPLDDTRRQELLDRLGTPEGAKELAERLRALADEPEVGDEAERQRALEDAERQLGEGEGELREPTLVPMPGPGQRRAGKPKGRGGAEDSGDASSPRGDGAPGRGGGPGRHDGKTDRVDTGGLRSRADARLNPGAPNPGSVVGRAPGRAGETARIGGDGRLGEVAPGEVSGMDRSEIPREYREQVGRYFPPR